LIVIISAGGADDGIGKESSFKSQMTGGKMDEHAAYVSGDTDNYPDLAKEKPCAEIILGANIYHAQGKIHKLNGGYVVELEVLNKYGIHFRPAKLIVESTCGYGAEIKMFTDKDTSGVDAKGFLNILTSGSSKGDRLRFEATGEGAIDSLNDLVEMFNNQFGEE
jgi:phosphotransferase system HPr (HPr) family protein